VLAWASDLLTGSPISGVTLSVHPGEGIATSGHDGLGRLDLRGSAGTAPESPGGAFAGPPEAGRDGPPGRGVDPQQEEPGGYVVASLGDDTALLPQSLYYWGRGRGWGGEAPGTESLWYVFDDRAMYRPGEQVHLKGWIRLVDVGPDGEAFSLPARGASVAYQLMDSRGNQLLDGTLTLNALGGFHTSFVLPETMNLGTAGVHLTLQGGAHPGASWQHSLQVQEFRRPEFEVSASASEGPHFAGEHAVTTVEAKYFASGPLPNADVTWRVTSRAGSFRPPNRDDFSFGIWVPWWRQADSRGFPRSEERVETFQGTTDGEGVHHLRIDFSPMDPPQPRSVTAEATVMDVNRQAWSASAQLLVHPADLYVGLRTETTFVQRGDPLEVEAIVTDLDGNAVEDRPIQMRTVRLEWTHRGGRWVEEEKDEQSCAVGSGPEPVSCTFRTDEGGRYRITATVADGKGRRNLTEITRWVSGGRQPSAERVEQEDVTLIPDRREYQPGGVAEILVQAPFAPAEGLLTLRRAGIVHTERFRMEEATHTLRVEVTEAHMPNVHVQVDLVGAAPRLNRQGEVDTSLPPRPAFARGTLDLAVPAHARTLAVQATPRSTVLEPGGETTVDVLVTDAARPAGTGSGSGRGGGGRGGAGPHGLLLGGSRRRLLPAPAPGGSRTIISDDGSSWPIRTVLAAEEMQRGAAATRFEANLRQQPPLMRSLALDALVVAGEASAAGEEEAVRLRTEFTPLATFAPEVPTDGRGRAAVTVKVPDNLTRYRVMAVAVAGDNEFGKGESAITARLPLMVRPSPPRFLHFGDRFELPVVVQNQTDGPMEVDVVVRATNVEALGSQGVRVTVPANDRREVRFPFATSMAGTARFQAGAVSGPQSDAAQLSLPVYTPATTEAFAVYGTLDEGAVAQPVLVPDDVYPQFGGLDISTSSTALQALSDAVLHLASYPFEGSEQVASRILAVAALRDVLSAFQAEGLPSPDELLKAVERDIDLLRSLQNRDGGFPIWQMERDSWPFHSIHAAHALVRAREKGFAVPEGMLSAALGYLRAMEAHYPAWYGKDVRNTLTAYALFVRELMGDGDPLRARRLLNEEGPEGLQPEALGFLLRVLSGDPGSAAELSAPAPPPGQPGGRDRRHGQLRRLVSGGRRLPPPGLQPPCRRHHPGCPHGGRSGERPRPQAGAGPPGPPKGLRLEEHPGERLHPSGPGPVLLHLRSPDAGVRGPCLAGR
jgi:alpha-2-macroglobulin